VVGFDFSTSAVKASHIGKGRRQTFEMVGTALFLSTLTFLYGGLLCFALGGCLALVGSTQGERRVILCERWQRMKTFDNKTLKFWIKPKTMGSKLIVGIPGREREGNGVECVCVVVGGCGDCRARQGS
jgi:hypothetical protein